MKLDTSVATMIGDVVASRRASDRAGLHEQLSTTLARLNDRAHPLVPLHVTTGDEFQACFRHLGDASTAALRLRLALLPDLDLRFGLGWGQVTLLEQSPRVEDGPGWWAARDAIVAVATEARKAALRSTRTAYRRAADTPGPDEAAVNAALRLRDHLVGSLSGRSRDILRGLLDDTPQVELAEQLGISPSAVSQRVRADGLGMIVAAETALEGVR